MLCANLIILCPPCRVIASPCSISRVVHTSRFYSEAPMTTVPRDVGHLVRYFSLDPSTNLPGLGSRIALQARAVSLHPRLS